MMIAETDNLIIRSLKKNETAPVIDCDYSADTYQYGDKEGCFAIISKQNKKLIGTILCPDENQDLIMTIHKSERDLGYGDEALSIGLNFLFGELGRNIVTSSCSENDVPAMKILFNAGMEKDVAADGKQKWKLTRTQWELL